MMKKIKSFLNKRKLRNISKYAGLSDFLIHASDKEKKAVFFRAAELANEDQAKIYNRSSFKTKNS